MARGKAGRDGAYGIGPRFGRGWSRRQRPAWGAGCGGLGRPGTLTVLALLLHLVGPAGLRTARSVQRGGLGQRGQGPAASTYPGPTMLPRPPSPPPGVRPAPLDSLEISSRHFTSFSTQPNPGLETGSEGNARLPVPPRAARPQRPQRPLRSGVEVPAA